MDVTNLFSAVLVTLFISDGGEVEFISNVHYASVAKCEETLEAFEVMNTDPHILYLCEWN